VNIPPLSPHGLIQEALWPQEWLILVSCTFLNQTTRKQVEKVWKPFTEMCPTPQVLLATDPERVKEVIRSLGFKERRTKNLYRMSEHYLAANWDHATDLPGIGPYAGRSWEIFCQGRLGDIEPHDHALRTYWLWCKEQIARGTMRPW
jgi:methyl-CpG-binding domain protein 4